MPVTLNPGEEAQLRQTIEMFEVITLSQPHDYQSLEILKEAYLKLGMEKDVIQTSKRIAQAYIHLGQLSSAILEFETILQRHPDDRDALLAMEHIEHQTTLLNKPFPTEAEPPSLPKGSALSPGKQTAGKPAAQPEVDDGRAPMHKIFVESKPISAGDFEPAGPRRNLTRPPASPEPFIQILAEKQFMPLDKSLKLLADRSRLAYLPLDRYDTGHRLGAQQFRASSASGGACCPFDRMSKTMLVATCNPFNKQAAVDLAALPSFGFSGAWPRPPDLVRILGKDFR